MDIAPAPDPRRSRSEQTCPDGEVERGVQTVAERAEMRLGKNERPSRIAAWPADRWASTEAPRRCCIGL